MSIKTRQANFQIGANMFQIPSNFPNKYNKNKTLGGVPKMKH